MAYCAKCGKELPEGSAFCPSCGAPAAQAGAAPQAPVSGFDTLVKESRAQGHWFRRLVAFVIDAIIVNIAVGIVAFLLAIPFLLIGGIAMVGSLFAGVFSVVSGIALVLYFAIAEVATGASIGKHIMGLRVRTTSGGAPNFAETLVRNISKVYWVLLLLDVVVGLATSKGFTQKFSDKFIGTDVVSV
ncbi:MAG: RDD family protein [Nitrososphaerales archaeon]|nr:RDD family protein [Nitrososphaerales archaeon]